VGKEEPLRSQAANPETPQRYETSFEPSKRNERESRGDDPKHTDRRGELLEKAQRLYHLNETYGSPTGQGRIAKASIQRKNRGNLRNPEENNPVREGITRQLNGEQTDRLSDGISHGDAT
jgi:hypothetical protein